MKKIKTGILGGTFNPIHNGHLIMAEYAYSDLGLDEVWIMPTGNPPHKDKANIVSAEDRCNMIKLAITGNTHLKLSEFETEREGIIYTSDTLNLLNKKYIDREFYLIIGMDSLVNIRTWHEPQIIFNEAKVVVAARNNNISSYDSEIKKIEEEFNAEVIKLGMPLVDISSSYIRDRIKAGLSVKYILDNLVHHYITVRELYK